MSRWLGGALAASLFVNVFALGAIGGGAFMLSRSSKTHPAAARPISAAGALLPEPDRNQFRQAMRRVLTENRDLPRIALEGREAAAQLFVAPQFDAAAVTAALDRARAADMLLRTRLETAAVAFAGHLPADERFELAQGLQRGGPLRHPAVHPAAQPAAVERH